MTLAVLFDSIPKHRITMPETVKKASKKDDAILLGHVGWDGSAATSERVILRAAFLHRNQVDRNRYVWIEDDDPERDGFLARVIAGPFFHRTGEPTIGGFTAGASINGYLLVDLEIQGELVKGRARDTNSRPMPGAPVYAMSKAELASLYGFDGDMQMGCVAGQEDNVVQLQSGNKSVLPRNVGIFGTVGSGKSNTTQVLIEEAARCGWAVIVVDVEGEYIYMDEPCDDPFMIERLEQFGRSPEGISDFTVYYPASCGSDKENAEAFALRLADFETPVIGEILQVSTPERNALLDSIEYLQHKAMTRMGTSEPHELETLLDASPQAKLPFTLRSLRDRVAERGPRSTESTDYTGLAAKLGWLINSEAIDLHNMAGFDALRMMTAGRVSIIDVSIANRVIKNLVTADLLRKTFAAKMMSHDTPPTLIVLEEAHSFISSDREKAMQATLQMLQNVIRRGRKRWLSIAFVSQQPGHLPAEVFELCNTRFVHALKSSHNLDRLIATTGGVGRDLWARCPLLGPGQCVVNSPQLRNAMVLSVRPAASKRRFAN